MDAPPLESSPLKGLFAPWRLKPPVLFRSRTGVRSHHKILAFNHQEAKILLQGPLSTLKVQEPRLPCLSTKILMGAALKKALEVKRNIH